MHASLYALLAVKTDVKTWNTNMVSGDVGLNKGVSLSVVASAHDFDLAV